MRVQPDTAMEAQQHDFLHYECSIHVDAPPDRVWEVAGDVGRSAEWAGSGQVLSIDKVTPEPVGVGTRYRAREKIGFRFESESEIVVYEPCRRIVWYTRPLGFPFPEGRAHRWAFHLSPEEGGTRLVQELRATKATGFPRLMQKLATVGPARRSFMRGIDRTLDDIKALAQDLSHAVSLTTGREVTV